MKTSIAIKSAAFVVISAIATSIAGAEPGENGERRGKKGPGAVFQAIDANGDGGISPDELAASKRFKDADQADVDAAFAKRDGDGDGVISKKEFAENFARHKGKGKGKGKRGKGAGKKRGGEGAGEGRRGGRRGDDEGQG